MSDNTAGDVAAIRSGITQAQQSKLPAGIQGDVPVGGDTINPTAGSHTQAPTTPANYPPEPIYLGQAGISGTDHRIPAWAIYYQRAGGFQGLGTDVTQALSDRLIMLEVIDDVEARSQRVKLEL